jgi:hypothetical protein
MAAIRLAPFTTSSLAAYVLLSLTRCCAAFVLPAASRIAFTRSPLMVRRQVLPNNDFFIGSSSTSMISLDFSSQVSDGIRTAVLVLVAFMVLAAAVSAFVTQSVLPSQMEKLALLVEQDNPERFSEIQQKLDDGQTIRDRPDLMAELVEAGINVMQQENEEEMENILKMVQKKKEDGAGIESIKEPMEAALGMTIQEFIAKVDKNPNSEYLTGTTKDLAEVLRKELS